MSTALKVARLRAGQVDILEPGLAELVVEGQAAGRLEFVVGAAGAVEEAEVVFFCLPTPMGAGGAADLSAVESVAAEISDVLPYGTVVVTKSTVPVGTSGRVRALLGREDVAVVSNPEFLREGTAVKDFLHPDRIVVGSDSPQAAERVAALFAKLGAPTVLMDAASAEMVKYAANCFLAMKLSYVNAVAELCERLGADVESVTEGMGYDKRIGQSFLRPGPGWGGSCLPKDTHAMVQIAEAAGVDFGLIRLDDRGERPRAAAGGGEGPRSLSAASSRVSGSGCSDSRSRQARTTCVTRPRWPSRSSWCWRAPSSPRTTPRSPGRSPGCSSSTTRTRRSRAPRRSCC